MINGNSLILSQPNTRRFEEIKALILLRIKNCNNPNLISILYEILYDQELDEKEIKQVLIENFEELDIKEEFKSFIDTTKSTKRMFLSKIKKKAEGLNPYIQKNIEDIQRNLIVDKLKNANLDKYLDKEKRIVLILDNYRVHTSLLVKEACKYLNIELIFLPTSSPHLNPIEQVWKSIKKYLSQYYLDKKEIIEKLVINEYYRIVDNISFFIKWVFSFIPNLTYENLVYELGFCQTCVLKRK